MCFLPPHPYMFSTRFVSLLSSLPSSLPLPYLYIYIFLFFRWELNHLGGSQGSHIAEAKPLFPLLFHPIFPSLEFSQPTQSLPTWSPSFCLSMSTLAKCMYEVESKTLQSRLVGIYLLLNQAC